MWRRATASSALQSFRRRCRPHHPLWSLTSIFHADAERDQYFSPRVYALGDVSFDHNFSQGLQLQQVYGGGIGWTALKSAKQELDLKADIHYEKQQYITTARRRSRAQRQPHRLHDL